MSIKITKYTSYDEIRTTVGLSEDHLPDATLALPIYAQTLELALDDLTIADNTLNPIKTVFATLDKDANSKAYNLTRLFSTYLIAHEVAMSLSMRAPKTHSDSKVTLTRFSPENTWRDVAENIKARLSDIKEALEGIGASTEDALPEYFKAVAPATDPVTGSGLPTDYTI